MVVAGCPASFSCSSIPPLKKEMLQADLDQDFRKKPRERFFFDSCGTEDVFLFRCISAYVEDHPIWKVVIQKG